MTEFGLERDRGVVRVEINRPDRSNALSGAIVEDLLALLEDGRTDGTRLVVFTGAGRNFCSGFDLGDLEGQSDGDLLWRLVRVETLLQSVYHAPFVTCALAQGRVVGAGVDLFCACAVRVAANDATFRMPGWRFGVALGTRRLIERVGADVAREVLLESRTFDIAYARQHHLVQQIVDQAEWPPILNAVEDRARGLSAPSVKDLLAISASDTRSEDMASLIATAARPGLKQRILDYREREKAARARPRPAA